MEKWLLDNLVCPHCDYDQELDISVTNIQEAKIAEGLLSCPKCHQNYPIINGIPRFVRQDENYAENFGYQWHRFRITQIDRLSNHSLSGTRLMRDTQWPRHWIQKKLILDAGCGAGRFTDELAQNGARVIALDMSSSVDACKKTIDEPYEYSSTRGDVAVIQADLLKIPLKKEIFDGIHCAGVIQHTSDPKLVEQSLPKYLKPGGKLFYNFYEIDRFARFQVIKYGLRHWTPKWQPRTLAEFSRLLCVLLFHLSWAMSRIRFVRFFNRFLPICSVHPRGIPLSRQFELTLLDTIDWYGPHYELRQDHKEVSELLTKEGLTILSADSGLVRAKKPNLPR